SRHPDSRRSFWAELPCPCTSKRFTGKWVDGAFGWRPGFYVHCGVCPLKGLESLCTDSRVGDDKFFQCRQVFQLREARVADFRVAEVKDLNEWKVTEERKILISHLRLAEGHDNHFALPYAVSAKRFDAVPSRLRLHLFVGTGHFSWAPFAAEP